jgi:S-(hydroxymethyl)glutathione dehydrogenase/alcohol dehydrogenase
MRLLNCCRFPRVHLVIGCGATTGAGAGLNSAKIETGAKFGLDGISSTYSRIQDGHADKIIGVDLNPSRVELRKNSV